MKTKGIISFLITLIVLIHAMYAGVGTTGAQFLKIGPSARALGMAGAFSAVSDDVYALWFNPAGLVQLQKNELSATYLKYFADVDFGFLGYAKPDATFGPIAFGITYLIVKDIEKRNEKEELLGNFNAKDIALTVAYAKNNPLPQVLPGLNLGGNIKFIQSEIDQIVAYTLSLDIALMYSPTEKINTAILIQNISYGIKFKNETDPLPLNLKFALAAKPQKKLTVGTEIDGFIVDQKLYLSLGGEYWVIPNIAVRCGYKSGYDTASLGSIVGLCAGLGFRIWNIGIDYAFVPFGELGDTHRVSLLVKF
ncbi:MAG: PorV/PorQ family protein [Endomicrobia bacterium]|nr:PorV/PorQ family protein [Endomicrobiia bacterium]